MTTDVTLKIYGDEDKKEEKHVISGRLLGAVDKEEANHIIGNLKIAGKVSTSVSKSIEDTHKALMGAINNTKAEYKPDRIVVAIKKISSPETGTMLESLTRQLFISDSISLVKESHIKPGKPGSSMTLWCKKDSLIICKEEEEE
jgi:hypothetical protein